MGVWITGAIRVVVRGETDHARDAAELCGAEQHDSSGPDGSGRNIDQGYGCFGPSGAANIGLAGSTACCGVGPDLLGGTHGCTAKHRWSDTFAIGDADGIAIAASSGDVGDFYCLVCVLTMDFRGDDNKTATGWTRAQSSGIFFADDCYYADVFQFMGRSKLGFDCRAAVGNAARSRGEKEFGRRISPGAAEVKASGDQSGDVHRQAGSDCPGVGFFFDSNGLYKCGVADLSEMVVVGRDTGIFCRFGFFSCRTAGGLFGAVAGL